MDKDKVIIALGVALLIVASATVGALVVSEQGEDRYAVEVEVLNPEEEAIVAGTITVEAEYHSNSLADLGILKIDGETVSYLEDPKEALLEWELDTGDYLDGEHDIEVVVRNQKGIVGSASHQFRISNGGTTVSIRSPSDGATVSGSLELSVDAVSPRGVAYVAVRLDGVEIGNDSVAPYAWNIDTSSMENGEHGLVVVASDALGVSDQDSISLFVDNPFTIVDERGREVSFPSVPKRIVSLGSSFTEVLFAIGADAQVVGVDSSSKYPAEVSQKTNVGSFFTLNLEAVLATSPDCIVTWTFATTTVNSLEANGLKVVCYYPKSIDGVLSVIDSIGTLTGHQSEAADLTQDMTDRIQAVTDRVALIPDEERPEVYFELRSTKSVGPGTITHEIITLAGGKNIYATATITYPLFNSEYIINADPDVIVIEDQSTKTNDQIKGTAGWDTITAVQEDRILRINGELVSTTPRVVDALEQLEAFFFPG